MTHTLNHYFDKYFHAITALVILFAMLFFSTDALLTTVGLRAFYTPVGMGLGICCLLWSVLVFTHNRLSGKQKVFYSLTIITLVGLGAVIGTLTHLIYLMLVVGWFTGFVSGAFFIPPYAIAIAIFGILITQIILTFAKHPTNLRKIISVLLLFYSAGYFIGFASLPHYGEARIVDKRLHNNHQYFLYLWYGWLGDPDYLALYKCNNIGIYCEVIYQAPSGSYSGSELSIVVDTQTQIVGAQIDDQFSPIELTEADVAYLCNFFRVGANDPFCKSPHIQDFTTFWSMIRRNVDEINYETIAGFFEKAGIFGESKCPPPERSLFTDSSSLTCKLIFPGKPFVLELRMSKSSSDKDSIWYGIRLTNPTHER
jgi:hypothetical protein